MRKILPFILLLAISLTACTHSKKNYRIGVSQCSNDIWRDKQNAELRMGAYFHENVELLFATADDSDEALNFMKRLSILTSAAAEYRGP